MRDAFTASLQQLAKEDPNLILITGDLGFGVLKPFWETYPDQFINAGIAEQAMTGMAAGMALSGKTVFTYSIGNFPTLRCLEQIRNDCAYHDANVKVVCVGGGFVYGALGMSHHATEDMAIMRALPGVSVFTPGDPEEVRAIMPVLYRQPGTCYLRLGRGGEPTLHPKPIENYRLGQALCLHQGTKVCLLTTGGILSQGVAARDLLIAKGLQPGLYSFPTIKPIDKDTLLALARNYDLIVTIEEHNLVGGFYSALCEVLAPLSNRKSRLIGIGMPDVYASAVGDQQYLRSLYGLAGPGIAQRVRKELQELLLVFIH